MQWAKSAFLLLLGFERGLLTTPFIANSATRETSEQSSSARYALTIALMGALVAAVALAVLGVLVPATLGQGLLLFAPWLLPAFVQELGRYVLFRDGHGRNAAVAGATWLAVMAATAPIAFVTGSEWAVTGCWGVGAVASVAVVTWKLRWTPAPIAQALAWWRREVWPFGRWILVSGLAYAAASYGAVLALAAILGTSDYGGLRATESLFAPLTLIAPAIALPGLPLYLARPVNFPATRTWRCLATRWSHCNYHHAVLDFPVRFP